MKKKLGNVDILGKSFIDKHQHISKYLIIPQLLTKVATKWNPRIQKRTKRRQWLKL